MKRTIFTLVFVILTCVFFCSCSNNERKNELVNILTELIYDDSLAVVKIDHVYNELINGKGMDDLDIATEIYNIVTLDINKELHDDDTYKSFKIQYIKDGYDIDEEIKELENKHEKYHEMRYNNEKRTYINDYNIKHICYILDIEHLKSIKK